jgi:hypothetical protein
MPELRALPDPLVDPADVALLAPEATAEQCEQAAQLATLMLQAALYPGEPPDPLPPPMYQATLMAAGRLARAGDPSGQVVSESLGAYSYRLQLPMPADQALAFTDYELGLLEPWLARTTAYDVRTPTAMPDWPYDWFQRNLDNVLKAAEQALEEAAG